MCARNPASALEVKALAAEMFLFGLNGRGIPGLPRREDARDSHLLML